MEIEIPGGARDCTLGGNNVSGITAKIEKTWHPSPVVAVGGNYQIVGPQRASNCKGNTAFIELKANNVSLKPVQ